MAKDNNATVKRPRTSGIEIIYTLFLALMVSLFFGLGISAFYESPKPPDYPKVLSIPSKDGELTQEQINAQTNYEKSSTEYQVQLETYSRNVSAITLGLAVIALVVSLVFLSTVHVISNGLMLGGVFTIIYSIIRGLMTDDSMYEFTVVTVGLVIVLFLGYIKFIKPYKQTNK